MALEQRYFPTCLAHIFGNDGLGRYDGPVNNCLNFLISHQLGNKGGEIGGLFIIGFSSCDFDTEFFGSIKELFFPGLAETGVTGNYSNLFNPHLIHFTVDFLHGKGIFLRGFEHVAGNRIYNNLGSTAGDKRGFALLGNFFQFHGLTGSRWSDDGQNLVFFDELFGK